MPLIKSVLEKNYSEFKEEANQELYNIVREIIENLKEDIRKKNFDFSGENVSEKEKKIEIELNDGAVITVNEDDEDFEDIKEFLSSLNEDTNYETYDEFKKEYDKFVNENVHQI